MKFSNFYGDLSILVFLSGMCLYLSTIQQGSPTRGLRPGSRPWPAGYLAAEQAGQCVRVFMHIPSLALAPWLWGAKTGRRHTAGAKTAATTPQGTETRSD